MCVCVCAFVNGFLCMSINIQYTSYFLGTMYSIHKNKNIFTYKFSFAHAHTPSASIHTYMPTNIMINLCLLDVNNGELLIPIDFGMSVIF